MTNEYNGYFFCYSLDLRHYLKRRGFSYVCTGLHPKTKRQFWLFERKDGIQAAIDEFNEIIHAD